MKNLNAENIKNALECCNTPLASDCNECGYRGKSVENGKYVGCVNRLTADALSLIQELTEENDRLRGENAKYEAENHAEFNKWLKLEEDTKRHHAELCEEAKIAVKEETIREMQKRLRQCFDNTADRLSVYTEGSVLFAIDQVAKEMLEGEK